MGVETKRNNYTIVQSEPEVYVDNESRDRSGHMSHAMAQWEPGKVIVFNSSCSAQRFSGHSTFGWVEYRTSEDGCETFSEVKELPYTKKIFYQGIHTISVEKAVACDDGRVVAFCLRNDSMKLCEPWGPPTSVTTPDGGKTWEEPVEVSAYPGRIYDARYYQGVIYVLEFCNDAAVHFCGSQEDHLFRIFTSYDNGHSFQEHCVVPIPTHGRGYGALLFDDAGRLHVYAYNMNAETEMDHIVSEDLGKTWGEPTTCYVAKKIRNPQVNQMDGVFLLHGRTGGAGKAMVLYSSEDGQNWDEGYYVSQCPDKGTGYYSNNIVLEDSNGNHRMRIQFSEPYESSCVNVMQCWVRIKR